MRTISAFARILVISSVFLPAVAQETRQVPVEGLIYDLRHPDSERRIKAAQILGENRVRQAVPALIDTCSDQDAKVRLEAIRALVRINDTRALNAYIERTSDDQKLIQEKAIEGLINIYVTPSDGFVHDVKTAFSFVNPLHDDFNALLVEPYIPVSQRAVDALQLLLQDEDHEIRKEAAVALGILRAGSAVPAIKEALSKEEDDGAKVELIRTSYKIGDPAIGSTLIPLIHDENKKVHDEAIFAIGRLRIVEAIPELRRLYESGVEERRTVLAVVPVSGKDDLRRKVLEAMAHIGDPQTKDIFINGLADARSPYRLYAAEGLGRIGEDNLVQDIANAYQREASGDVRLAMAFALYRLGRTEYLIELVRNVKKKQVHDYLMEMEGSDVAKLYPFLETEKDDIRIQLLDIIGLRGDVSALPPVEKVSQDETGDVAAAANHAIRRLRGRFDV